MKLVWFEVCGFKRFGSISKLHVDGKLIAIVGPNEGGKTSLLQAFQHLNNTNAVVSHGPSQQTTRGKEIDERHNVFEATFLIDDDDREALTEIPEAKNVRWFSVAKKAKGETHYIGMKPSPKRNLASRSVALSALQACKDSLEKAQTISEDEQVPGVSTDILHEILLSDVETFDQKKLSEIITIAKNIESHCVEFGIQDCMELPKILVELSETESAVHPEERARNELYKRVPKFLRFTDSDRLLESEYDLNSFYRTPQGQNKSNPQIPKAMQNIADAAGLNVKQLFDARLANDEGKIESILNSCNACLLKILSDTWSQSSVTVRVRMNNLRLHILVGAADSEFVQIAERSDGLRQFVALLMFLYTQPALSVKPILLIDEVERHLHYDAQADIVQMLARQKLASKVIYTTHSIGCLPEDLGVGIKLVEQIEDELSIVNNWFWHSDRPGFSSLLFGMGASSLAFIPVRFAVIVEGTADVLLLPTLIRQAIEATHLGFQVAPGLSIATPEQLCVIDSESPRTIYLTDGDAAGVSIRRKILSSGIPGERIMSLPIVDGGETVIEDFVSDDAYVAAVNRELHRSHGDTYSVIPDDVKPPNRPLALRTWCREKKIAEPAKRAVCYQILENVHEVQVMRESCRSDLRRLYEQIRSCLQLG